MYQIKNVVNYDREEMDREIEKDMERFYKDKRIPQLMRRSVFIRYSRTVVSTAGLLCSSGALVLALLGKIGALSRVLALLGLLLSSLSLFVLSSAVPKALLANIEKLSNILDTYGYSPAMKYHSFLVRHNCGEIEIWGAETDDAKFEVTLSKTVDGQLIEKDTFICDYEERSPGGVLTLDVRNGVVLRQLGKCAFLKASFVGAFGCAEQIGRGAEFKLGVF